MANKSYQARADQALVNRQWQEASDYLQEGVRQTANSEKKFDDHCRMKLRLISMPLFQDAVNYKEGRPSQLSDSTIYAVDDETTAFLAALRGQYARQFPPAAKLPPNEFAMRQLYVGVLAKVSLFGFCVRARADQLDEVLPVPALAREEHAGTEAHGMKVLYPHGQDQNSFRVQTRHRIQPSQITRYVSDIVVLGYTGEGGIDTKPVSSPTSLSRTLCVEDDTFSDTERLDSAYFTIRDQLHTWPERRTEMLANLVLETETRPNTDSF